MSTEEKQLNEVISPKTPADIKKKNDDEFKTIIKGSIIMAIAIVVLMLILDGYDMFMAGQLSIISLPINFSFNAISSNIITFFGKFGLF